MLRTRYEGVILDSVIEFIILEHPQEQESSPSHL